MSDASDDWRTIALSDIQWSANTHWPGIRALMAECKTLGDLEALDVKAGLRIPGVGGGTLNDAVAILRRAIAGEDVRRRPETVTLGDMARMKP